MLSANRRFYDLSADDKAFESFTLPNPGLTDLRGKIPNLLDGVEHCGLGFDETPLVRELVDNISGLRTEFFRILVDTVKVKP